LSPRPVTLSLSKGERQPRHHPRAPVEARARAVANRSPWTLPSSIKST
jgi:hypothetical protein